VIFWFFFVASAQSRCSISGSPQRDRRHGGSGVVGNNKAKIMKRLLVPLSLLAACAAALADPVANAAVVGIMNDAKATFDAVLVPGLIVMGTLAAIGIGARAWKRVSK